MEYYDILLDLLTGNEGYTSIEDRKQLAAEAFDISSHYDAAIYGYFMEGEESASLKVSESQFTPLRYGENPHQQGRFYGDLEEIFDQLHGKELSYNNILDVDAAVQLIGEFHESDPTFVIMKHNNACGVATRNTTRVPSSPQS